MKPGLRVNMALCARLVGCACALVPPFAPAQEVVQVPPVEVIGTVPLPGLGTPLDQVPSNVQTFGARDLSRQRAGGVAEFLNLNANSVSLNSPTGNPFQPDVSFRGFTASSLLGTPQGLSVFQDGVRINEAFADVVNWDLLPKNAVASMQLLPGSNPVFGLNTLGGALTLNMKDGFRYQGAGAEVSAGSFGRTEVSADAGIADGSLAAFAAFEGIDDNGWRDHTTTRIRRLYARVDARSEHDEGSLAATLADNNLEGTQALPVSMLPNPKQAYTWPDNTENRLGFFNGNWKHTFDAATIVAANAYYRKLTTSGINSNVNGEYAPPDDPFEAFNIFTDGRTRSWGASLQATFLRTIGGDNPSDRRRRRHRLGQHGLRAKRPARGVHGRARDGRHRPVRAGDGGDDDQPLRGRLRRRYDRIQTGNGASHCRGGTTRPGSRRATKRARRRRSTAPTPTGDSIPRLGATWTGSGGLNAFGGVSQGMRVPSPVELTCADPTAPCTLPNIFVADPPLQPVRATTYEIGVRGKAGESGYFRAALYRTDLADDIQFISAGQGAVNAGYFQNVGRTRRQGLELTGGTGYGPVPRGGTLQLPRRDLPDGVHREQPEQRHRERERRYRGRSGESRCR